MTNSTGGLWGLVLGLILGMLILMGHMGASIKLLKEHEGRIRHLERMLDGAIEQVDHAASDIDILETKIHDLRAGERGW